MKYAVVVALSLCILSACGGITPGPNPPDPPQTRYQVTVVVCEDGPSDFCTRLPKVGTATVLLDDTGQTQTNEYGFASAETSTGTHTLDASKPGYQSASCRIDVPAVRHCDLKLRRLAPPLSRIRAEGRFFVNDAGTYRGVWTSGLSLLAPGKSASERAAFLDWAKATGFDGVRVFAGDLGWAGQTPDSALANLPAVLEETKARGLYLYLVAITGSVSGYNVEDYLARVAAACAGYHHCVLEAANELGHSSQSAQVNDIRGFEAIAVRVIPAGQLWMLGAMLGQDEPVNNVYPPTGAAPASTAHLDRGRQPWPDMIRRIREIAAISETTGKPAISGEPIGAAETEQPGRRSNLPELFYAYGALCRLFELGACVFHSEDGLLARPLGPVQQSCAQAFLEGVRSIDSTARLGYRNSGWAGSDVPVESFTGATRVYSGVTGTEGYTVVVGDVGVNVVWKNGYRVVAEMGRRSGVIVWKIAK